MGRSEVKLEQFPLYGDIDIANPFLTMANAIIGGVGPERLPHSVLGAVQSLDPIIF